MTKANCEILITCDALLPSCERILNHLSKTLRKIYSMNTSTNHISSFDDEIGCLPQLFVKGRDLPKIEMLEPRDAFRKIAFYLTTSGTSGPQVRHPTQLCHAPETECLRNLLKSPMPP